MKKRLIIGLLGIISIFFGANVSAANQPNLRQQIFPLECSLDSVALGNVNSLQLTPENCMPGPQEPPTTVTPSSPQNGRRPFFPGDESMNFLHNPVLQIPSSNFPVSDIKGPLIVDPGDIHREKTADQIQITTVVISAIILLVAGFLAAAHAVYTGILSPLIAHDNRSKLRFPWSRK